MGKPRSSGKYSHILPHLPRRVPEDAKHEEKLAGIRAEILADGAYVYECPACGYRLTESPVPEDKRSTVVCDGGATHEPAAMARLREEPDDQGRYEVIRLTMEKVIRDLVALNGMLTILPAGRKNASVFARAYAEARQVEDVVSQHLKVISHTVEAYEKIIADVYDAEGIKTLKLDDGNGSVRVEPGIYAQVIDRETFRQWCIKQGLERSMHLHPSSTTSMVKDMLLNHQPEPPGVRATFDDKIVFTKG